MAISNALLKYGHSFFSLKFLEYCSINTLMVKELYYFSLIKPEYNIGLKPGCPSKGIIVSDLTKHKMKLAASNRSLSTRLSLSISQPTCKSIEVTYITTGKKLYILLLELLVRI